MAIVTPADRPKSVRNRCVIKVFGGVRVLPRCFFSVVVGAFVIGLSKIEKVPMGIQGEKSSKDMASSRNLVSTIGAQTSPKRGRNQVSGRVSDPWWHVTSVANAPWKPLIIRWRSSSVLRSWNWWKVWLGSQSQISSLFSRLTHFDCDNWTWLARMSQWATLVERNYIKFSTKCSWNPSSDCWFIDLWRTSLTEAALWK